MTASRRARRALALATIIFVGGASSGAAAPTQSTIELSPTADSWYHIGAPIGLPTSGAPDEGVIQVGENAGLETARAYLAFPFDQVETPITRAELKIVVDTSPASGTLQAVDSTLQACISNAPITSVRGSLAQPPPVDCSSAVSMDFSETSAPQLTADITPLVSELTNGASLVLIADISEASPSWRIVFSAHDRDEPDSTPAAMVSIESPPTPSEPTTPDPLEQPEPTVGQAPVLPPTQPFGLPTPSPQISTPPPNAEAPGSDEPPDDGIGPSELETAASFPTAPQGFAYPAVLLLPLALALLVPMVVRTLSTNLDPIRGHVS